METTNLLNGINITLYHMVYSPIYVCFKYKKLNLYVSWFDNLMLYVNLVIQYIQNNYPKLSLPQIHCVSISLLSLQAVINIRLDRKLLNSH